MSETIRLGEIAITVTRKAVKHAHLSVYPPGGRVTLVAPNGDAAGGRACVCDLETGWIRDRQEQLRGQARAELNELPLAAEAWKE